MAMKEIVFTSPTLQNAFLPITSIDARSGRMITHMLNATRPQNISITEAKRQGWRAGLEDLL